MRLSVASVVLFPGLFGVEVRTYKFFENKHLATEGAGKIFRKTARLDLVRPSRPRKHLLHLQRNDATMRREDCKNGGKRIIRQIQEN